MEVKFIGTGGAFDVKYGNSALTVKLDNKLILIDCGYTVFPKLLQLNIIKDIDYVFITHFHSDHVGSFDALILYKFFVEGKRIKILCHSREYRQWILDYLTMSMYDPTRFVEFAYVQDVFTGINKQFIPIDTYGCHVKGTQSYGLFLHEYNDETGDENSVVFTGDIKDPTPIIQAIREYNKEETLDGFRVYQDTNIDLYCDISYFDNEVHMCFDYIDSIINELKGDSINVYGYHCNPERKPDNCDIKLVHDVPELNY